MLDVKGEEEEEEEELDIYLWGKDGRMRERQDDNSMWCKQAGNTVGYLM